MIVAPIELAQSDALSRSDKRTRRFQKKAHLVDRRHVRLAPMMDFRVAANLIEMFLIIHRSADDFAWIRDGTQKLHAGHRLRWRC